MAEKQITVTSPLMPSLDELNQYLQDIWQRKWITNNGYYHKELEKALCEYLDVPFVSLFTNGTLPLITALQALRITGEVITTPYSGYKVVTYKCRYDKETDKLIERTFEATSVYESRNRKTAKIIVAFF